MNEFEKLISCDKPVLVDFHATWCGPCKMMGPILEDVKKQVGDDAVIIKVDVDKNQVLSDVYGIRSVPTLMLFKAGNNVWRASGIQRAEDLVMLIEQYK